MVCSRMHDSSSRQVAGPASSKSPLFKKLAPLCATVKSKLLNATIKLKCFGSEAWRLGGLFQL